MSKERKIDIFRYRVDGGPVIEERTRRKWSRGGGLAEIPTSRRLVDVYCPAEHLAAVLVTNEEPDGPPVVLAAGPSPAAVLKPDGLACVVSAAAGWLGTGNPEADCTIECPQCGYVEHTLTAASLAEAMSEYAGKTRRVALA